MAKSSSAIETRNLSKVFKDFWLRSRVKAVNDLSLSVERGLVYGLLGPNGSGKSTTIKMILGLLYPTAGQVSVLGHLPNNVANKSKIGYLPEESYLYRFLDARETLHYYGRLFHIPHKQRKVRIDQLLEMVGLDHAAHRPLSEYSKGMQRRLGLAQALINDPELLILDEPTTGMDPQGTKKIKDLILTLKEHTTVLLSSHLLDVVEDVSDRVAILYGGKLQREGTVEQLLTKSDKVSIELNSPSQATLNKIEALLEAEEGTGISRVTHPRERLEDLFLSLTTRASDRGDVTHGAKHREGVAAFLNKEEDASALAAATAPSVEEAKQTPVETAPTTETVTQEVAAPKVEVPVVEPPVAPAENPVVAPAVEEAATPEVEVKPEPVIETPVEAAKADVPEATEVKEVKPQTKAPTTKPKPAAPSLAEPEPPKPQPIAPKQADVNKQDNVDQSVIDDLLG